MNSEKIVGSKYSLSPFFELSSDPLCIAGFDGYFKKTNPALSKLLGYSTEELLSRPINTFIHPDDQELTEKHRENIRNGKPLLNFENRYVSKEGETVWLDWTSMPVHNKSLVYAIAKNITHKKKHEQERNKLLSKLTSTNESLIQLTYSTSHDLRAPISSLLAVFSLLDTSTIKDTETLELLDILHNAVQDLKRDVDNYVDNLHNDENIRIKIEELDLKEIFDSVINSISLLITDSNTTFNISFDEFSTVEFNWVYLESIFLNLISNSIKYAHPNRDPVITITSAFSDGRKQLIFSDNGLGFDNDQQKDKIFGLHQTFHDHQDSKGIGLYLVYNHIKNLGGDITVDSKVNEGTTFTLTFKE